MNKIESINLEIIPPCKALDELIHSFWSATNLDNTQAISFEILNDGYMGLVFNFSGDLHCELKDQLMIVENQPVINGASCELSKITFSGKINTIGVRFLPTANLYFFNRKISEMVDRFIVAKNENLKGISEFNTKLHQAVNIGQSQSSLIKMIEGFLIDTFNEKTKGNPYSNHKKLINDMINAVAEDHEITVDALCDRFKINVRQLQRLFKKYFGMPAKTYIRLRRIQIAKSKISEKNCSSLTDVSIESGFFDQSHFIKEFKGFMQLTPNQYAKRKNKELNGN